MLREAENLSGEGDYFCAGEAVHAVGRGESEEEEAVVVTQSEFNLIYRRQS